VRRFAPKHGVSTEPAAWGVLAALAVLLMAAYILFDNGCDDAVLLHVDAASRVDATAPAPAADAAQRTPDAATPPADAPRIEDAAPPEDAGCQHHHHEE